MLHKSDLKVAVIGSGAAGLSAAWLMTRSGAGADQGRPVSVTLFEKDDRLGGHAHTASVKSVNDDESAALAIDTGFIVFNELNYPNFTAWMNELDVATVDSQMSFAVSRNGGDFEYKGGELSELFAQPANLIKPRFWRMLRDLVRFYRQAKQQPLPESNVTLGEYLAVGKFCEEFVDDHLLPFGAAIWSSSRADMLEYPAASFLRFCDNHGLLNISDRPQWKTVKGGSSTYVEKVRESLHQHAVKISTRAVKVRRLQNACEVIDGQGNSEMFDQIVFATHADQTLEILDTASVDERRLLGVFSYSRNLAILHTDVGFLPKRAKAWSSWNYIESDGASAADVPTVSYWMNSLQSLDTGTNYMVTLNPSTPPASERILRTTVYEHPVFTTDTFNAQKQLWSLQGQQCTWFCGAYFGAGFHEDAIQSGFAVAEALCGVKRPWSMENPSSRIFVSALPASTDATFS